MFYLAANHDEDQFVDAVTAMGDGDFSQAGKPYQLRLDV